MENPDIEMFAAKLVQLVRDQAIHDCYIDISPQAKAPESMRDKSILANSNLDDVKKYLIPRWVDAAIFCLLDAIDNQHIKLLYVTDDGRTVDLNDEGMWEMAGRYIEDNEEGWRVKYSKEAVERQVR